MAILCFLIFLFLLSILCTLFHHLLSVPLWCLCCKFPLFSFIFSFSLHLFFMSLFCRPVWISGNRSAFSECHQEWLSSHRRYCGSNLFQCGSAIIINHETETVYKANGDNVMSSQLIDSFKLVLLSHLFSFIGIYLYLSFDTPQCRGTGSEMMIKTELHVVQMKAHSCLSNSLTVSEYTKENMAN